MHMIGLYHVPGCVCMQKIVVEVYMYVTPHACIHAIQNSKYQPGGKSYLIRSDFPHNSPKMNLVESIEYINYFDQM